METYISNGWEISWQEENYGGVYLPRIKSIKRIVPWKSNLESEIKENS